MPTYLQWETSGGKKGRCDAKCHNAKGSICRCCCQGAMHGKARQMTPDQFKEYQDFEARSLYYAMNTRVSMGDLKSWSFKQTQHQLLLTGGTTI